MRTLELGSHRFTEVKVLDEPAIGNNACHEYAIGRTDSDDHPTVVDEFGVIHFQNGPIKEAGVNGCHHEDLINIVIDRLDSFQKGSFRCRENALAITKLEEALMWLNKRTQTRINKGIEGKNINHE